MAIVECNLFEISDVSVDQTRQRSYTHVYSVQIDDPLTTSEDDIIDAPGILFGAPHPTNLFAYCVSRRASKASEDGTEWHVSISYGALSPDAVSSDNPLLIPCDISGDGVTFQKVCKQTIDGKPIVNSAKDPYEEPLVIDDSRPVIILRKNVAYADFNPMLLTGYRNAINSTPFLGAAKKTVLLARLPFQRLYHQDIGFYWQLTGEFHHNPETWVEPILDQGYRGRLVNGAYKNLTVDGVIATRPMMLDGAGNILPVGDPPVYNRFRVRPELPFTIFNHLFGV